ncbi:hypothetical protein BGX29_000109, partial [Mortierella sp. GBA35]
MADTSVTQNANLGPTQLEDFKKSWDEVQYWLNELGQEDDLPTDREVESLDNAIFDLHEAAKGLSATTKTASSDA